MKVYILHYDTYDFGSVHGVFATKELAEKAMKMEISAQPYANPSCWDVEEWEVEGT